MFKDVKEDWKNKKLQILTDMDTDGTTCNLIFRYNLNDYDYEILQSSASKIKDDLIGLDADVFVFSDLTPPEDWYSEMLKIREIFIFDHHISAYEVLSKYENLNYNYDISRCSARILYDWFDNKNNCMSEYVRLVDIYDRYLGSDPDFDIARGINNLLFWYVRESRWKGNAGYLKFIQNQSEKFKYWGNFRLHQFEQIEVDKEYEKEKIAVKKANKTLQKRIDIKGNLYGYFELDAKISYVASVLLNENPDFAYVLCRNLYIKDYCKFSLRSKNFNVMQIARKYGGGGHHMASAFSTDDFKLGDLIKSGEHKFGLCYFSTEENLSSVCWKLVYRIELLKIQI